MPVDWVEMWSGGVDEIESSELYDGIPGRFVIGCEVVLKRVGRLALAYEPEDDCGARPNWLGTVGSAEGALS